MQDQAAQQVNRAEQEIPAKALKQGFSLRALFAVSGFTFLSRILGYARDLLLAASFGTSPIAQAFFVAFRLPNMFRRIFAEGALSSAFVPNYSEVLEKNNFNAAQHYLRQVLGWLLLILLLLSAVMLWFMPQVIGLLAPGFRQDPQLFSLTVLYARVQFPYLIAISVMALGAAVLQTHRRFAVAAAAPIALNVVMIAAMLFLLSQLANQRADKGLALSWVILASGFVQLVIVLWALRRAKLLVLRPILGWSAPLARTLTMLGPAILSAGVWHINTLVNTMIASQEQKAVAILYYADRLYQLPLGLIGVTFSVVLLPFLSQALNKKQFDQVQENVNHAIELALFIALPAMVVLFVIPQTLSITLFERGDFLRSDSQATALALRALAFAIPAAVLSKIFLPLFYAHKDTKSPFSQALISVFVNVVLALFLFAQLKDLNLGFLGLAIASAAAAWVMLFMQLISVQKRNQAKRASSVCNPKRCETQLSRI